LAELGEILLLSPILVCALLLLQLGRLLLAEENLLIEALPVLRRALLLGLSSLALVCSGDCDWWWNCPSRLSGRRRRISRLDGLRSRPCSLEGLRSLPSILDGLRSLPSILDGLRRRVSSLDWLRSRPSSLDGLRRRPSSLDWLRSLLSYLCGRRRLWTLLLAGLLYARRRSLFLPSVGRWRLIALVLVCRLSWCGRIFLFPLVALRVRCGACADHQ
jgi:hypothetical protein